MWASARALTFFANVAKCGHSPPKTEQNLVSRGGGKKNRKDAASVDASANDESSVIILQLVRESVA